MSRDSHSQNFNSQSDDGGALAHELEWLAFRYVSDELPESEREQFEKRLENDLSAQTALVNVMQQAQLINAALDPDLKSVLPAQRSSQSSTTQGGPHIFRAVLSAAAAILLLVAGWHIYSGNQSGSTAANLGGNAQNSSELAFAWADSLAYGDLALMDSELDELVDEVELVDFVADGSAEDWMFIALVEMEDTAEILE